jgi:hypothetical protein
MRKLLGLEYTNLNLENLHHVLAINKIILGIKQMIKRIADVVAVVGAIMGSSMIACNIGYNVVGYIAFLVSGVATVYLLSLSNASNSLKLITYFYLIINVVGIIRYAS